MSKANLKLYTQKGVPHKVLYKNKSPRCTICNSAANDEINYLLKEGVSYSNIIKLMKEKHPELPLNNAKLSRHKPHSVGEDAPSNDAADLVKAKKEALELLTNGETISLEDALAIIIKSGVQRIVDKPDSVTPARLIEALRLAKEIGMGADADDFNDAWTELHKAKKKAIKATRTTESVELTEVEDTPQLDSPDTIEGEILDDQGC